MFKKLVTSSTSTVAAQNAGRQNLLKASAAKLSCSKSYSSEVAEVKGAGGLVDRMFYTFKPSDLINDKFSKLFCIEGESKFVLYYKIYHKIRTVYVLKCCSYLL